MKNCLFYGWKHRLKPFGLGGTLSQGWKKGHGPNELITFNRVCRTAPGFAGVSQIHSCTVLILWYSKQFSWTELGAFVSAADGFPFSFKLVTAVVKQPMVLFVEQPRLSKGLLGYWKLYVSSIEPQESWSLAVIRKRRKKYSPILVHCAPTI